MIKNKSLFKNISILFILIPMLLLSLFIINPKREKINVYADSTVTPFTFVGSRVVVPMTDYNLSDKANRTMFVSVQITFGIGESGYYFIDIDGYRNPATVSGTSWVASENFDFYINSYAGHGSSTYWYASNDYRYKVFHKIYGNLTSSISRVTFGSEEYSSGVYYQVITYYDSFNNYFQMKFMIEGSSSILNSYLFSERTYYLNLGYISDSVFYEQGYTDGYSQGLVDGNNEGYDEGYNVGRDFGYNEGFNDGVEDSNSYSFNSLFGAVIDVPVNAFTSLLNFELLGINILGFISGLLTLALIIFIIKLCLGGK